MQPVWIIIKKELHGYACSPLTFIFVTIFLAFQMGFTFILGRFYESNQAGLDIFFSFQPWLYLFLIPAIGMRIWAEEKSSGTIETLATLPLGITAIIAGKFAASWLFVLAALLLTFPIILTVYYLGSPDPGPILSGYLMSWLMAGAFLAIACFTSALTRNQVISFVLSVIICFVFLLIGFGVFHEYLDFLPVGFVDFLAGLGFIPHFQKAIRGVIELRDVVYFISIIVFFLILNAAVLDKTAES
jgi:ABC-2 type transport system permease protein